MPSCYAHHRFGQQAVPSVPENTRRVIEKHRRLFDLGLQGPDFFFYYRPWMDTPVRKLGHEFHYQTGREFFSRVCRELEQPTEEELAYLYGLLGHYCLDAVCHPRIHELARKDDLLHNRLESEFDRYLMERDGISRPHFRNRGRFLSCGIRNCRVAARFYPGVSYRQIREALWSMRLVLALLMVHPGAKRVLRWMGGANPGLLMENCPAPVGRSANGQLLRLYEEALGQYPVCLEQLQEHGTSGKPFGKELEGIFG